MSYARPSMGFFVLLLWSAAELGAAATTQAQDQPAAALSNPVAAQSLDQLSTTLLRRSRRRLHRPRRRLRRRTWFSSVL